EVGCERFEPDGAPFRDRRLLDREVQPVCELGLKLAQLLACLALRISAPAARAPILQIDLGEPLARPFGILVDRAFAIRAAFCPLRHTTPYLSLTLLPTWCNECSHTNKCITNRDCSQGDAVSA